MTKGLCSRLDEVGGSRQDEEAIFESEREYTILRPQFFENLTPLGIVKSRASPIHFRRQPACINYRGVVSTHPRFHRRTHSS